jgi:hypothetical protein
VASNWKMINKSRDDEVWEVKDDLPVSPQHFIAMVAFMQAGDEPFRTRSGVMFDPANFDGSQLWSFALDMLADEGARIQIVESDGPPTPRSCGYRSIT